MASKNLRITWLGHGSFKIQTPGGKALYLDPWLTSNPSCPDDCKTVDACDIILLTHGHFDHTADVGARLPGIDRLFLTALRYEYLFWEAAYCGESWPG